MSEQLKEMYRYAKFVKNHITDKPVKFNRYFKDSQGTNHKVVTLITNNYINDTYTGYVWLDTEGTISYKNTFKLTKEDMNEEVEEYAI